MHVQVSTRYLLPGVPEDFWVTVTNSDIRFMHSVQSKVGKESRNSEKEKHEVKFFVPSGAQAM